MTAGGSRVSGVATGATQLPSGDAIFLDHIGHFAEDREAAAAALADAGFAPTPVSVQVNPDPAGGPPKLTGTGNVCAMLRRGYIEVLFKTADTPLGLEFEASRARYPGLHLVAFATADAPGTHNRLEAAGFQMQPVVQMQRPVGTATGEGIAAFEVVRLAPGQMPEGRVQMLRHKTEDTVWQPRWLEHPNGVTGLAALTIVEADVAEAARRFGRFLGRSGTADDMGWRFDLDRGALVIASAEGWGRRWPEMPAPALPFMGECGLTVRSLAETERVLAARGYKAFRRTGQSFSVRFPEALGLGVWTFSEDA